MLALRRDQSRRSNANAGKTDQTWFTCKPRQPDWVTMFKTPCLLFLWLVWRVHPKSALFPCILLPCLRFSRILYHVSSYFTSWYNTYLCVFIAHLFVAIHAEHRCCNFCTFITNVTLDSLNSWRRTFFRILWDFGKLQHICGLKIPSKTQGNTGTTWNQRVNNNY